MSSSKCQILFCSRQLTNRQKKKEKVAHCSEKRHFFGIKFFANLIGIFESQRDVITHNIFPLYIYVRGVVFVCVCGVSEKEKVRGLELSQVWALFFVVFWAGTLAHYTYYREKQRNGIIGWIKQRGLFLWIRNDKIFDFRWGENAADVVHFDSDMFDYVTMLACHEPFETAVEWGLSLFYFVIFLLNY